jgi:uncharacterized membrane protein HdeD (DUF308 family)
MQPILQNWWALVLRGLFAVLLGLLALFWPGMTLFALVVLFGAYALADGMVGLAAGLAVARQHARWWPFVVEGLVGTAIGVITFGWPRITALALLYLIAAWAIATGVLEIAAAVRLRRHLRHEWLLALSGIASVLLGLVLAAYPKAGALAMVTALGIYGIIFGSLLVGLGLRLKIAMQRTAALA